MESDVSSSSVVVAFVEDCNQRCYLPPLMIKKLNCLIGDYVSIRSATKTVLCQVLHKSNVAFVQADETVSLGNQSGGTVNHCRVAFPFNFTVMPVVPLNKIKINVIFRDFETLMKWHSTGMFKRCTESILSQYAVVSGCIINCRKLRNGKICGIAEIKVLDIYQDGGICGKYKNMLTAINIESTVTEEQVFRCQKYADFPLGGLDDIISNLKSAVNGCTMSRNSSFPRMLITGPSGCGKSSLIENLCSQTNAHLISVRPVSLCRMSSSECEKIFDTINQAGQFSSKAPCILFIDDIDNSGTSKGERSKIRFLTLALLDISKKYRKLIVFGSANSSRNLHPSLKTSKGFTIEIPLGVPNLEQREEILKVLTNDLKFQVDVKEIAEATPGYVGSDLYYLVLHAEHIANSIDHEDVEKDSDDEDDEDEDDHEDVGNKVQVEKNNVSMADFQNALKVVEPSILKNSKFKTKVKPIFWNDIGGLETIKKRAQMYIQWPILHPAEFSKVGLPCPKGVLLFGPPGCCKTTLVRVLATECKATFLSASPAEIYASYVGESEKSIIELFRQARLCAPSIIFLDEIDSLVGRRSYSDNDGGVHEKVLTTLLNEMDGFGVKTESLLSLNLITFARNSKASCSEDNEQKSNEKVLVVAATNRIDRIDDALLRPGRFDSLIYVPPPNAEERKAVLQTIAKKMDLKDDLLEWLAKETEFFSGADLKDLCRIAGISAIKEKSSVARHHFVSALKLAHPSITQEQLKNYEKWASRYGPVIAT